MCTALECIWPADELQGAASWREGAGVTRPPPAGFLWSPEDLSHPASRPGKVTFGVNLPSVCTCYRACFRAQIGPVSFKVLRSESLSPDPRFERSIDPLADNCMEMG